MRLDDVFEDIYEELEENFENLSEEEVEDYADDLTHAIALIERVIDRIEDSCELDEDYEYLDEARAEKKPAKVVWRLVYANDPRRRQWVGFDPATFDSISKYAGTNDGGGIPVYAQDKMKAYYEKRREKSIDKFNQEAEKDLGKMSKRRADMKDLEKEKEARVKRLTRLANDEEATPRERARAQAELDQIKKERADKKVKDRKWKRALARNYGVDEKDVSNAVPDVDEPYKEKTDKDFRNESLEEFYED